ncbi:MAG: prepilin-type N-terminal cleavage/methylation domain-containing protein [Candidatus Hydrogenedentes bacterium]|nr:prepilin-type N-terminal cleavage/methylation domain-containing protein [Candidatus Hydrogenedentota bacterium]
MKSNSGGFTLIELMIVVEIISIIVAIGVPNYIRARVQANEAKAIGNLKALRDAEITYNTANYVYTADFADLIDADPAYLSDDLRVDQHGFTYRLEGDVDTFVGYATPVQFGVTGWRSFRIDDSGTIRYGEGVEPDENGTPIWD